jgi:hypothetical protein
MVLAAGATEPLAEASTFFSSPRADEDCAAATTAAGFSPIDTGALPAPPANRGVHAVSTRCAGVQGDIPASWAAVAFAADGCASCAAFASLLAALFPSLRGCGGGAGAAATARCACGLEPLLPGLAADAAFEAGTKVVSAPRLENKPLALVLLLAVLTIVVVLALVLVSHRDFLRRLGGASPDGAPDTAVSTVRFGCVFGLCWAGVGLRTARGANICLEPGNYWQRNDDGKPRCCWKMRSTKRPRT